LFRRACARQRHIHDSNACRRRPSSDLEGVCQLVREGCYSKAASMLQSPGCAPATPATVSQLSTLHPARPSLVHYPDFVPPPPPVPPSQSLSPPSSSTSTSYLDDLDGFNTTFKKSRNNTKYRGLLEQKSGRMSADARPPMGLLVWGTATRLYCKIRANMRKWPKTGNRVNERRTMAVKHSDGIGRPLNE
jgi:hypothetical protein